ncbi:MAG: hypothetical protein U0610_14640 [bacterium]
MIDGMQRFTRIVGLFHLLGGARRVYRPPRRGDAATAPLGPVEEEVLRRCAEGTPLGALVDESRFDEEETLAAVRRLLDRGAIEHA